MATSAQFWDGLADRYARQPVKDMSAYETTLERTRSYLKSTDRVLEIGAGTGSTALHLANRVEHYTTSDYSAGMTSIAVCKIDEAKVQNVDAVAASVFDHHFDGKRIDSVIAFNLLHLIEDREATLARVHELLAPGGLFISKTPALAKFNPIIRLAIPFLRLIGKAPFVAFLTPADLEEEVKSAGFKIVETGDYPAKPPSHFIVARRI